MGDSQAYVLVSWLDNRAHCQCGWQGRRRWFRGSAVLDVVEHGVPSGHMPVGTHIQQMLRSR